jgi:hypothetical protein
MQFSPRSVFLPFRSTYPQHFLLKNPQSLFTCRSERPSFAPIQHKWQNYSSSPCSQKPVTGSYTEPASTFSCSISLYVHFNIVLPPTLTSQKRSLPFTFLERKKERRKEGNINIVTCTKRHRKVTETY